MSKSLRKDFRREIKKSISRFISIMLIVVLGVAFYSGIRSAMPAMRLSADAVYDKENLMDIRIVGTLGLTDGDLNAVKGIEGVENVEGSFTTDFLCLANSAEVVTKVIAMPESVNDIKVSEGKFPEKFNECVVSREFLTESGLKVGDFMTLLTGTDDSVFDTLAAETYTIVGVCSSSYFLNGNMGTSSIGDGVVDGFVVIPKEAFVTDVYTSLYLTVSGAKELECYGEDYKTLVDGVISRIEAISERRCDVRYSEVRSQSNELLTKARNEYNAAKLTAENELGDAYQQLLDGEKALNESKIILEEKKALAANAAVQMPKYEQELAEAKATLENAESMLSRIESTREQRKADVDKAKAELEKLENDPTISPQSLADARSVVAGFERLYNEVQSQYEKKSKEVEDGWKIYNEKKRAVDDLKNNLPGITAEIESAEKRLQDEELRIQSGKEQYEISKQDAFDELSDAETKLSEAEREINNMETPVWYVLGRNAVESYLSYENDFKSIGAIGTVFPIIFFLVAALVSLTTMTRMVEEERTQIGTLKALGYGKFSIASKFIVYALSASLLGSIAGMFLGEYTIPEIIVRAYKMVYYNLDDIVVEFNPVYGITAALAATFCTTFAAFAACYKELRSVPAQLMRPEAPKGGKRILLERISFIWDRLNFSQKAAFRNLFRYKKRFFMTLFGVGGCMALLLVGLGIRDSVAAMANNQYGKVFSYDATVSVDATLTRAQRRAMLSGISDISEVESVMQANRTMVYASASTDYAENKKNAYMIVPRSIDDFKSYVTLKERAGLQLPLELSNEGVIITEKYANLLGVSVNDSIFIRQSESDPYPKEVKVTGITENYIFNYIYMTPTLYQTLYTTAPDLNMLMLNIKNAADTSDVSSRLLQIKGINSVTMNEDELEDLHSIINRLYFVIVIMIIAAGVLAFVVLYNLNNINISERSRELATLKLLGFYDGELSQYVFRENIILTVLGTVLGIFLGILLHKFVMVTVETDVYMFGRELGWWSILIGAALTVLFSVLVNIVMSFKLKKIDMVESLKSVE